MLDTHLNFLSVCDTNTPMLSYQMYADDHKIETTRDIHQRVSDELEHAGLPEIHLSFHLYCLQYFYCIPLI